MRRWLVVTARVTACVALGAACAGAPPVPAERFTNAEAEIKAAQEIGAENNPQGKLHLQQARDQLEAAKKLSKDKPEVAVRKLDSAQAEADEAKTRLQTARNNLSGTGGAR